VLFTLIIFKKQIVVIFSKKYNIVREIFKRGPTTELRNFRQNFGQLNWLNEPSFCKLSMRKI
jgi:hypothetical protein